MSDAQTPDPGTPSPGSAPRVGFERRRRRGPGLPIIIGIVVLALIAGTIAVIANLNARPTASPSGGAGEADTGATLRLGLRLEPTNLNIRRTAGVALEQALLDNVYQGLVSRTADGQYRDALAAGHEVSGDGKTYTFTLRDGVTFHNGAALTAQDVVASLTQVKNDASLANHADLAAVRSITAEGSTIRLTLDHPDSNLMFALAGRAGIVLKQGATNDLASTANGTGPFRVASWKQGSTLSLKRFDGYWGEKAKLAGVDLTYLPQAASANNAVLSGSVDVQTALDPTLIEQVRGARGYTIAEGRTNDEYTLAYNSGKAPLNKLEVRQALSQAIDTDAIIKAINDGGTKLGGPIPELDPGYEDLTAINAYNPDNAKKLLAAAGADTLSLTLTIPNVYGSTVSDLLVSQFAAVGVTLKVRQVEFPTWLTDVYTNKNYDLSFVNHAEARDFGNYANPDYYFNYRNPKVTTLYQQAQQAVNEQEAGDLLKQAARLVAEDAPAKWLYSGKALTAISDRVHGFPTDATTSRLDLAGVSISR
ncbi:ABC transporter substrate-binding protein [Tersicoccus solisilvae]|uniref:ABC transporter substrate-binding protein n=1 Tax=Tersicoccus solisilvae TaxID=1882339 RepID=A0ABQ1NPY8_9MICC|nr:ABC transporter substrate-binding protein [Tersicoccus solisilvae]GGC79657.1 ABC transporter substrate-binding protein [Tersicoccus solisilvae]